MSYVIAGYAITFLSFLAYGAYVISKSKKLGKK